MLKNWALDGFAINMDNKSFPAMGVDIRSGLAKPLNIIQIFGI
jgi:hypothetical protein